jgi:hypothetical protein
MDSEFFNNIGTEQKWTERLQLHSDWTFKRGRFSTAIEPLALNQRLQGSNPCTPTNVFRELAEIWKPASLQVSVLGYA